MEKEELNKDIIVLKNKISKAIDKTDYEHSLALLSVLGDILYQSNQFYYDDFSEQNIKKIGDEVLNTKIKDSEANDIVIFYDQFGFFDRGLLRVYLENLKEIKKVIYVGYFVRKSIKDKLEKIGITTYFIQAKGFVNQIKELNDYIGKIKPSSIFFYYYPNDVVGAAIMASSPYSFKRYLINLTDHAFWLGASFLDYCIEFRDYGASISYEYRKIPKNKILKLPFYPYIDNSYIFQGFPFEKKKYNQVVFSGGSIYKTIDKDNTYYKIVDSILEKNKNVIFWYAGLGDSSRFEILMKKYPERCFLTPERKDLFAVLCHCTFYLSTYPICGGLMFQYAASAGKVPVTLKPNELNDGFLINQKELGIEFFDKESMMNEINKLLNNPSYCSRRGIQMRKSIISKEEFKEQLLRILDNQANNNTISFHHIDVMDFHKLYLDNFSAMTFNSIIASKKYVSVIRYYPIRFLKGALFKVCKKVMKK